MKGMSVEEDACLNVQLAHFLQLISSSLLTRFLSYPFNFFRLSIP